MFLFSLIPGAGQMYMGFMKQGLSLMTIFATLCAVGIWLDIKPLLFFAPIILLYSFFDATNKNSMDAEAFKKLEDHYLWGRLSGALERRGCLGCVLPYGRDRHQ